MDQAHIHNVHILALLHSSQRQQGHSQRVKLRAAHLDPWLAGVRGEDGLLVELAGVYPVCRPDDAQVNHMAMACSAAASCLVGQQLTHQLSTVHIHNLRSCSSPLATWSSDRRVTRVSALVPPACTTRAALRLVTELWCQHTGVGTLLSTPKHMSMPCL